jgi:16S rRNA (uracil1498-N3)-methyltransferase
MRIPRIYHPEPIEENTTFRLTTVASQHLLTVLRLKENASIIIFDGKGGEYQARIFKAKKHTAIAKTEKFLNKNIESPLQIHLGQAISRSQKMDYILQKAVEMGVTDITPLFSEHSSVKLTTERLTKRMQHWQQIIIHACQQSGRTILPMLHMPIKSYDWVETVTSSMKITFHPAVNTSLKTLKNNMPNCKSIACLIGPEGGLSDEEITAAKKLNFEIISLGPRVLRTETASIAALTLLQALWGDLS